MQTIIPDHEFHLSRRPLYATLVQFPAVCFVGALLADITYFRSESYIWENFSVWLLAIGCVLASVTGVVGLAMFVTDRRVRAAPFAWPYAIVSIAAALLAVVNAFVHSRDGYTAVVPTGLTLSCIVVILMVIATALSWSAPRRRIVVGEAA